MPSRSGQLGAGASRIQAYRTRLRTLGSWDDLLLKESGLPGPRANLELAQAVAEEGDARLFERYLAFGPDRAPTGSPHEFLALCGTIGQGRLAAEGKAKALATLRRLASDPRWRIREGVAMALQRVGETDMDLLLRQMVKWSSGNLLEKRAAAAALCEPRLLEEPKQVARVLNLLDAITASLVQVDDRRSEEFKALKKGLGYCWSVAVAALYPVGKKRMARWLASSDPDVRWIMRENLKKDRLARIDRAWVAECSARLDAGPAGASQASPRRVARARTRR